MELMEVYHEAMAKWIIARATSGKCEGSEFVFDLIESAIRKEATETAVQLVLNGIVDQYQGARIILAHADGFLPYASHRFAELARVFRPDAANPAEQKPHIRFATANTVSFVIPRNPLRRVCPDQSRLPDADKRAFLEDARGGCRNRASSQSTLDWFQRFQW